MANKVLSCELTDLEKNVGNSYGGKVRCYKATFDLAALAAEGVSVKAGDLMKLCDKPQGRIFRRADRRFYRQRTKRGCKRRKDFKLRKVRLHRGRPARAG